MPPQAKLASLVQVAALGFAVLSPGAAQADKVHWKEDPKAPGCFALAFDDTNQWFATPAGLAFKKGVCFGQAIKYKVDLAQDGESFTASGARSCTYQVGKAHHIAVTCGPNGARPVGTEAAGGNAK